MRYLKTYENADKTNDYQVGDMNTIYEIYTDI